MQGRIYLAFFYSMMLVKFYKYQGTGNDFVIIDNRLQFFDQNNYALIQSICDRRFGVGADGLILLENDPAYDFRMVYFNADGKPGSMCGNGGRCIVKFAFDIGVIKTTTTFIAADGEHDAFIKDELVHLKMKDVRDIEKIGTDSFLNTGSPHYVMAVKDIQNFNVFEEGATIRNSLRFKSQGTNVNFMEPCLDGIWVRTYERGVEDETFSCGTGVTAAALTIATDHGKHLVAIKTRGGSLQVSFVKSPEGFSNIHLIGPAVQVFEGTLSL